MKKLNYFLLGAAGLMLASCSQEEVVSPASPGEGNFHVTVSLPGNIQTRNTGLAAENLLIAVYDADNDNALVLTSTETFENSLQTTVGFNLANGKTYNIALFATSETPTQANTAASDSNKVPYTFDATNKQLIVNYEYMVDPSTNAEKEDCFYNVVSTGVVGTADSNISVTLYRPIAQINWGTSDLAEEAVIDNNAFGEKGQFIQTNLSTQAFNTLNLLTGDVTGDLVDVNLYKFNAPAGVDFPVQPKTYQYIAMQYLLAPKATSDVYDLTLNVDNGANTAANTIYNDVVVVNAPVQANYQTNIYGALLTDNVNLTVIKSPEWAGSYLEPQDEGDPYTEDDGTVVSGLYLNKETKVYTITNSNGLEYFAQNIAGTTYNPTTQYALSGYTVLLGDDIDMKGVTHYPFMNGSAIFDGQGHTISNLTVTQTGNSYSSYAGFMLSAIGTVQNINFVDANITGNYWAGVLAGDGVAAYVNNVNATGCTVTSNAWQPSGSGDYDDGNSVGGIIGYLSGQSGAKISNCSVTDCKITGYRSVGGIAGRAQYAGAVVSNNTVTNTTVTANQNLNGGTYESEKPFLAGEVVGDPLSNPVIENNTVNNVNVITINGNGEYTADTIEGLQQIFNLGNTILSNKNVSFGNEETIIDLDGATIEPFVINKFNGDIKVNTIDFNGATIKNFTVSSTNANTGLFGNLAGNISNLNIDNMTVNGGEGVGLVGYYSGIMTNVNISNSNFTGTGNNVGALVGNYGGGAGFNDCHVTNCKMTGAGTLYGVGGLVGTFSEGSNISFTNCSITGSTITTTGNDIAGSFLGVCLPTSATVTYDGCTVSTTTVNGVSVDSPSVTGPEASN